MICTSVIRHNTSAFSSRALLIHKRDEKWCFCINYTVLNTTTIKDKFSITVVEELLDELRSARFLTKLDLLPGYHQVLMHPDEVDKTAFRTHKGFLSS